MNKMKRLTVSLAAGVLGLALVAGQTMAQIGEPPQGKPGMHRGKGMWQPDPARHLQKLTKRLGLTAEQQEKIKPILDEEAAQIKVIDNEKLTRAERRAKMQQLHQGTFEKIKPLLTTEQVKKHDAMREKMRERCNKRQGPPPEDPAR